MTKFTKIENEILEKLITMNLSVTALSTALLILRKINGFHKNQDMISNSQIAKATKNKVNFQDFKHKGE